MSGRIRTIKPDIHDDVPACSMSDAAWHLWVGAWPIADDDGRFKAEPLYLSTRFWMGTPCPWTGVPRDADYAARALSELVAVGFIRLYRAPSGELYAEVKQRGWKAHQRIEKPSKWRNPVPNESDYLDSTVGDQYPTSTRLVTNQSGLAWRALDLDRDRDRDRDRDPLRGVAGPAGPPTAPTLPTDPDVPGPGAPPRASPTVLVPPPTPQAAKAVKQASTAVKTASATRSVGERFGPDGETAPQMAWRVWLETYQASGRKHGEYTRDEADGKHMIKLAKHALDLARERVAKVSDGGNVGEVAERLFRHWFRAYMRDDGSKDFRLVDVKHGLRWLTNVSRYGSPWASTSAKTPSAASSAPEPPNGHPKRGRPAPVKPEPGAVPPPPEAREAMARLGLGPKAPPVDVEARQAELREQAERLRSAAQ